MKPQAPVTDHDPNILLLAELIEPPRDAYVREDFARNALALYLDRAELTRLARVIRHCAIDRFKTILLALRGEYDGDYSDAPFPVDIREALKLTCTITDATILRIADLASDVLDWEGTADEFDRYIRRAWLVLTDEVQWLEERHRFCDYCKIYDCACWDDVSYRRPHTDAELREMARKDRES
jgi:hypothetical protein